MKKIYITILTSLLIPTASFAALGDFTFDSNVDLTLNGVTIDVSGSGFTADRIEVSANSFDIGISAGGGFEVTSSDRRKITATVVGSLETGFSCTSSNSKMTVSNPGNAPFATTTLSVSSDTCATEGGSSSSGGGGGGGGGSAPSVPAQTQVATPAVPAVPTVSPAVPAVPSAAAQPSAVAVAVSPAFNRSLTIGSKGEDVKRLQQLLNSDSDTVIAASGVGSPGNESEYFGSLSEKAVQKFQAKYGLAKAGDAGYGYVGPKTRAKLAEVFVKSAAAAPELPVVPAVPSPVAAAVSPVFNRALTIGSKGEDVKRIQQLLNSDPDTMIASSGVGSAGNETEYFGSLSEKAVQKFQVKYDVAKAGDAGYGFVGPKTRAKLAEVFGESAAVPAAPAAPAVTPEVTPAPAVTPAPTPAPAAPAPVPFWLQLTPATPGSANVYTPPPAPEPTAPQSGDVLPWMQGMVPAN
ncbi:MAG: peptidoglycan-binding protein [Candidatus Niyogibacteria bacterium]|nr:MAG: peptidoglycan-binding protein [Candidatus Niyogibacteria bacterium]